MSHCNPHLTCIFHCNPYPNGVWGFSPESLKSQNGHCNPHLSCIFHYNPNPIGVWVSVQSLSSLQMSIAIHIFHASSIAIHIQFECGFQSRESEDPKWPLQSTSVMHLPLQSTSNCRVGFSPESLKSLNGHCNPHLSGIFHCNPHPIAVWVLVQSLSSLQMAIAIHICHASSISIHTQ